MTSYCMEQHLAAEFTTMYCAVFGVNLDLIVLFKGAFFPRLAWAANRNRFFPLFA